MTENKTVWIYCDFDFFVSETRRIIEGSSGTGECYKIKYWHFEHPYSEVTIP